MLRPALDDGPEAFPKKTKTMNKEEKLERMRSGAWLHAVDPEIGAELLRAEELCFRLNSLPPSRREERERIVRELFGRIGRSFVLHSPFRCDFGTQISVGEDFVGNFGLTILDEGPVTIGDRVFIGPDTDIYTVVHALLPDQRSAGIMRSRPVTIGNDVWIGGRVTILPGVTIGDGAVIGAGSVVVRDIPAGMLAAGNPCRPLRPVTERDRIAEEELEGRASGNDS